MEEAEKRIGFVTLGEIMDIIIIIIIIIITTTISILLSSWQSHCESSLGSSDEYRNAADLWTKR